MNDMVLLPARAHRAALAAPTLTKVVNALIDGHPVQWDAAERRARTPAEQQMTREVRALTQITRACADGMQATRGRTPLQLLERALNTLAGAQVLAALAIGLLAGWRGLASGVRVGCMALTMAVALVLSRRGAATASGRAFGHLLLLVAAAQARPFLDLSGGVGAPLWLRTAWQLPAADAFLPLAAWRLAMVCPQVVRCSSFEAVSAAMLALALACSIGTAAAAALALLGLPVAGLTGPQVTLPMALGWGALAAAVIVIRTHARTDARRRHPHAIAAVRTRHVRGVRPWLSRLGGTMRGLPAARLAELAADLQRARSPRELASVLASHAGDALDAGIVAVVTPDGPGWTTLAGCLPPLSGDSAIAALLDSADDTVRVDRGGPVYTLLPTVDREWLALARVSAIVRLASREGDTLAALLVGASARGRALDRRDRAFMAAAARAAALALDSITAAAAPGAAAGDEDLAYECQTCGDVDATSQACACGGSRDLAALPACLHGAFRVERRIGRGGMGVVYLARDLRLDRPVALKTLPSLSSSRVGTLRAEARAMATLAHPSVAVIYGLEQWRGTPVLVAEYLEGGTLARQLAAGPLPVPAALSLAASVADALAALHGRGWLHRDIKPSNIGWCGDGTVKLLDFGLTRWHAADDQSWSPLAGTPLYLSPELLDGEPARPADDVWALALVVVEMITGVHPRLAVGDDSERPSRHVMLRRDLWAGAAPLPPGLTQVLAEALHPSLPERLTDAGALAAALRAVC